MQYFLQRADRSVWEEVDEFTFQNHKYALVGNEPRYNGNFVKRTAEGVYVKGDDLSNRDLAIICRFLGVRDNDAPGSVSGGFVQKPEVITFRKNNSQFLRQEGVNYRKAG